MKLNRSHVRHVGQEAAFQNGVLTCPPKGVLRSLMECSLGVIVCDEQTQQGSVGSRLVGGREQDCVGVGTCDCAPHGPPQILIGGGCAFSMSGFQGDQGYNIQLVTGTGVCRQSSTCLLRARIGTDLFHSSFVSPCHTAISRCKGDWEIQSLAGQPLSGDTSKMPCWLWKLLGQLSKVTHVVLLELSWILSGLRNRQRKGGIVGGNAPLPPLLRTSTISTVFSRDD